MNTIKKFPTLSKVIVINTLWALGFLYCIFAGYVGIIWSVDYTYISPTILLVAIIASFAAMYKAYEADTLYDDSRLSEFTTINKSVFSEAGITAFFTKKLSLTAYLASLCVILGLLGTILGFTIGFYSIDPATLTSFDSVVRAIGVTLPGISIAFYTTIAGILANVWIDMNHYVLNQRYLELFYENNTTQRDSF